MDIHDCLAGPHGLHLWKTGDGWGVIVGVSRCCYCDAVATVEHFEIQQERIKADFP